MKRDATEARGTAIGGAVMATTATKRRRVNAISPSAEIVNALDGIAEKVKDIALLVSEYATNFYGQTKAELDAAATSLRVMRYKVVAARMTVEDAEDAK